MAETVDIFCPEGEWTLVASSPESGVITNESEFNLRLKEALTPPPLPENSTNRISGHLIIGNKANNVPPDEFTYILKDGYNVYAYHYPNDVNGKAVKDAYLSKTPK